MPRRTVPPVYLALSPHALAAAFGVHVRNIYDAVERDELEIKQLPGTIARRILIRDAERWFRKHWK
jgi:hypothetical protein